MWIWQSKTRYVHFFGSKPNTILNAAHLAISCEEITEGTNSRITQTKKKASWLANLG